MTVGYSPITLGDTLVDTANEDIGLAQGREWAP